MTQIQEIVPTVSPNILSEIPRFFTNTQAMLREIIQNSSRAGASEIQVTATGNTLTFKDNGRGLDQPQVLLTVAQSNWEGVVDPAGMGILSTLNPEWVSEVSFRSHKWIFSVTPEEFAKASSIKVFDDEPTDGFELQLTMKGNPFGNLEKTLKDAKAINPITIILNGEKLPEMQVKGQAFSIPQGTLYLRRDTTYTFKGEVCPDEAPSYWEGFPTSSSLKKYILEHLAKTDFERYSVSSVYISFVPDPKSGVLPKLPDRNTFIENGAWHAAARAAFRVMKEQAITSVSSVSLTGEIINITDIKKQLRTKEHPLYTSGTRLQLVEYLLSDHFIYSEFDENSEIEFFNDPDDDTTSNTTELAFASRICTDAEDDEVNALRLLARRIDGLPFQSGYCGPEKVKLNATKTVQKGKIILCSDIHYGDTPLPWFTTEGELLIAGDAAQAEQTFLTWKKEMAAALMYSQWKSDARETFEIYTETTFDNEQGINFIHNNLNEFFAERVEARQRHSKIIEKTYKLQALIQASMALREYAHVLTPQFIKEVKTDEKRLQKEAAEIIQKYNLN